MKNMTKLLGLSAVGLALSLSSVACGDSEEGSGGSDTTSSVTTTNPTTTTGSPTTTTTSSQSSTSTGMMAVDLPTLGNQIDRMGRAAINTATTKTFTPDPERNAAEDAYNADDNIATWAMDFGPDAATALGVLDSLDANCGNQPASCMDEMAGCYGTLATVLTTDYIVVRGDAMEGCDLYLGVEAAFLGIANDTCGGRTTGADVIDTTYSIVAGVFPAPFGDEIDAPPKSLVETFPYLAPAP
jgi:hypothetical protein